MAHFTHTFGIITRVPVEDGPDTVIVDRPEGHKLDLYQTRLEGTLVARKADILRLPRLLSQTYDVSFDLTNPEHVECLKRIAKYVKDARYLLTLGNDDSSAAGHGLLANAQKLAASPLLPIKKPKKHDILDGFVEDDSDGLDSDAEYLSKYQDDPDDPVVNEEDDDDDEEGEGKGDGGEAPIPDALWGGLDAEEDLASCGRRCRSDPKFAAEWLEKLRTVDRSQLLSPMVSTILDIMKSIRRDFPADDKTLVVSQSYMLLDIIYEVFCREIPTMECAALNGTVDKEVRPNIQRSFSIPGSSILVLLLTA